MGNRNSSCSKTSRKSPKLLKKYEGEYKDGKRDGKGTMIHATGDMKEIGKMISTKERVR